MPDTKKRDEPLILSPQEQVRRQLKASATVQVILELFEKTRLDYGDALVILAKLLNCFGGHDQEACDRGECLLAQPLLNEAGDALVEVLEEHGVEPVHSMMLFAGIVFGLAAQSPAGLLLIRSEDWIRSPCTAGDLPRRTLQ